MRKLFKFTYMYLMPLVLLGIDINLYILNKLSTIQNNFFLLFIFIVFHIAIVISFLQAYRMKVILFPEVEKEIVMGIGFWIGYKDDELIITLPFVILKMEYSRKK
tara:strand:+ start:462 stop:776 length:315 start_codon:yes stop_codon:yes gene_type:complete